MIGAIVGDIIGSPYETRNIKTKDFPLFSKGSRFTDDTVLTVAVADSILTNEDLVNKLKEYARLYPHAGYGGSFWMWALSDSRKPYNSWGNGSAMRVSPVGFAYATLEKVLEKAKENAEVTHNHPDGIKGAQAVAASIFLARNRGTKEDIKEYARSAFGYDLSRSVDDIRRDSVFDVSCKGSVPIALVAFLESIDFEDTIKNAISVGGDSDTIACMAGSIAEAFYGGVPREISDRVLELLDDRLRRVVRTFEKKYQL